MFTWKLESKKVTSLEQQYSDREPGTLAKTPLEDKAGEYPLCQVSEFLHRALIVSNMHSIKNSMPRFEFRLSRLFYNLEHSLVSVFVFSLEYVRTVLALE